MRKPRILENGARYHVTARAHRREMIFQSKEMRQKFLDLVARAKTKYGFRLENFCLMGNHFHMIIRPREGTSLSRILQWILSGFARFWNKMRGFTGEGSVWGQRFFSKILSTFTEYLHTFFYINENPVAAGLVSFAHEWPYGSAGMRRRGTVWALDDPPAGVLPR